jgi:hypothetical protein
MTASRFYFFDGHAARIPHESQRIDMTTSGHAGHAPLFLAATAEVNGCFTRTRMASASMRQVEVRLCDHRNLGEEVSAEV